MVGREKTGTSRLIVVYLLFVLAASPFRLFAAEPLTLDRWAKVLADGKADTRQRMEAARKLGRAKKPGYLQALTEALKDGNKAVRWAAVEGLWDLGDKRAVPALIDYLEKKKAYGWGKILAMNALGSLKDPQAVDPLLRMLKSENPFLRRSGALALVRIGDERAIPGIIELLKDEEGWLARLAQNLLVELAEGKISDEPPRGYDAWKEWYRGSAEHLKIGEVRKK